MIGKREHDPSQGHQGQGDPRERSTRRKGPPHPPARDPSPQKPPVKEPPKQGPLPPPPPLGDPPFGPDGDPMRQIKDPRIANTERSSG
ncbi:hypothetical protein [Pendulispora albinea]|uniref:Uncharacterized protein n=1 Tax=Pendulispora albinea TaxID=2741071 RepID=A0ABZ2LNW7_9BACT